VDGHRAAVRSLDGPWSPTIALVLLVLSTDVIRLGCASQARPDSTEFVVAVSPDACTIAQRGQAAKAAEVVGLPCCKIAVRAALLHRRGLRIHLCAVSVGWGIGDADGARPRATLAGQRLGLSSLQDDGHGTEGTVVPPVHCLGTAVLGPATALERRAVASRAPPFHGPQVDGHRAAVRSLDGPWSPTIALVLLVLSTDVIRLGCASQARPDSTEFVVAVSPDACTIAQRGQAAKAAEVVGLPCCKIAVRAALLHRRGFCVF